MKSRNPRKFKSDSVAAQYVWTSVFKLNYEVPRINMMFNTSKLIIFSTLQFIIQLHYLRVDTIYTF